MFELWGDYPSSLYDRAVFLPESCGEILLQRCALVAGTDGIGNGGAEGNMIVVKPVRHARFSKRQRLSFSGACHHQLILAEALAPLRLPLPQGVAIEVSTSLT